MRLYGVPEAEQVGGNGEVCYHNMAMAPDYGRMGHTEERPLHKGLLLPTRTLTLRGRECLGPRGKGRCLCQGDGPKRAPRFP